MNVCYTCGEEGHRNWNCPKKGPIYYNCNQLGHLWRDYPKPKQMGQLPGLAGNPRIQQERVFNLTHQDTTEDLAVIQGTMFTFSFPMHVLIDSRTSHSFISHALAEVLGEELENLNCHVIVATPMGKSLETSTGYRNKKIQIGETESLVDLILLEF